MVFNYIKEPRNIDTFNYFKSAVAGCFLIMWWLSCCNSPFMLYPSNKTTLNASNHMWKQNVGKYHNVKKTLQTLRQSFHQRSNQFLQYCDQVYATSVGDGTTQWHSAEFFMRQKSRSSTPDCLLGTHRDRRQNGSKQLKETVVTFTQNKAAHLGLKSKLLLAEQGLLENQKLGQSLLSIYS